MKDREKRIKKEKDNLSNTYKSDNNKVIIERLIDRASVLLIVAEDMEKTIISLEQFTTTTINASQEFVKSNPLLKDYRDTVKSYQAVLKQLCDITKNEVSSNSQDELESFMNE